MSEETTNLQGSALRIDIVSDVVCPWCVIGFKQLERALELTSTEAEIHWHPFELNPHMPPEGENLREHLAAKYGTSPEESRSARKRLTALGADLGFTFDYADDMRMWNTFRAHQLSDWADEKGRGHEMAMALFSAFFSRRANVDDVEVLADVARDLGLDRVAALRILTSGARSAAVREREAIWTSRGIQAVPAVIFEERYLLSGAQGVETYAAALRQIAAQRAA